MPITIDIEPELSPYKCGTPFTQSLETEKPFVCAEFTTHADTKFEAGKFHPLLYAFHLAYCNHGSVEIRPDEVWCLIRASVIDVMNRDPEAYRNRFVSHEDKKVLVTEKGNNTWKEVIGKWCEQTRQMIGEDKAALFSAEFSTTTPVDRMINHVSLMCAMKHYATYHCYTRCGIRAIRMLGEESDWELLVQKVRDLQSMFPELVDSWLTHVLYVTMSMLISFKSPSIVVSKFWKDIYNYHKHGSGSPTVDGHLLKLFYHDHDGKFRRISPNGSRSMPVSSIPNVEMTVDFTHSNGGRMEYYLLRAGTWGVTVSVEGVYKPFSGWAIVEQTDSEKQDSQK